MHVRLMCSPEDHIATLPLTAETTFINLNPGQIFIRSFQEGEHMRGSWPADTHKLKWASAGVKSFPEERNMKKTARTVKNTEECKQKQFKC